MHAFLLINSDQIDFAKKQNAKVIPFELQKIEDARNLKKLVKFKFTEKTAIVIDNIDEATNETLNAFLKNLEEPNSNLIYILTASNLQNVLPTIVSRCELVRFSSAIKSQHIETNNLNKNQNENRKINYKDALNIKDREEAIRFIEKLLNIDHDKKSFENMENYLETIKNLKANGNVSLQLANFVVRMSSTTN